MSGWHTGEGAGREPSGEVSCVVCRYLLQRKQVRSQGQGKEFHKGGQGNFAEKVVLGEDLQGPE